MWNCAQVSIAHSPKEARYTQRPTGKVQTTEQLTNKVESIANGSWRRQALGAWSSYGGIPRFFVLTGGKLLSWVPDSALSGAWGWSLFAVCMLFPRMIDNRRRILRLPAF